MLRRDREMPSPGRATLPPSPATPLPFPFTLGCGKALDEPRRVQQAAKESRVPRPPELFQARPVHRLPPAFTPSRPKPAELPCQGRAFDPSIPLIRLPPMAKVDETGCISVVLSLARAIRTPCTPDAHRMYKGCTRLRMVCIPCASGVHPLYTARRPEEEAQTSLTRRTASEAPGNLLISPQGIYRGNGVFSVVVRAVVVAGTAHVNSSGSGGVRLFWAP